jgi:Zn-dependent protease
MPTNKGGQKPMLSLLDHVGPELPFTLLLLAVLGLRARVTPRTSLWINVAPEKLWNLLRVYDGKFEDWGGFTVRSELIDPATKTYRKIFSVVSGSGATRQSQALFRISDEMAEKRLELTRADLQNKSESNELLKLSYELLPEKSGTRLKTTYHWGKRSLLAQLLARTDLWGGAFRMKAYAETGKPSGSAYITLSIAVGVLTGLISVAAFEIMFGLAFALLLVLALFVHEFGHLLAYRLMGQPWGRIIFLPFLGAIAMPRLPLESQAQSVFAALMGPGFSALLALACMVPISLNDTHYPIIALLGMVTAGLNIFNMLPAEPLDGGVALRSVLSRVIGQRANYGLMAVGALICGLGLWMDQVVLVIFGGLAILANLKPRKIDHGLAPLTTLGLSISAFGYVAIVAAHISLLRFFSEAILALQS